MTNKAPELMQLSDDYVADKIQGYLAEFGDNPTDCLAIISEFLSERDHAIRTASTPSSAAAPGEDDNECPACHDCYPDICLSCLGTGKKYVADDAVKALAKSIGSCTHYPADQLDSLAQSVMRPLNAVGYTLRRDTMTEAELETKASSIICGTWLKTDKIKAIVELAKKYRGM